MTGILTNISFSEWQKAIAPMWNVAPETIPIVNNPYRVIQYPVAEWKDRILFIPMEYREDGEVVGYISVYNVSDTTIRYRGIYILPEHRGCGAGHRMCALAVNRFAACFNRVIGFYKAAGVPRFLKHGGMRYAPLSPLWSEFSQTHLYMLYRDRAEQGDPDQGRKFVEANLHRYGFGGVNNLNRSWTDDEWMAFVAPDALTYPDVGLRLDF